MAKLLTCDICRKPCEEIIAKLFFSPSVRGSTNSDHANYSHHLDIGNCCDEKIKGAWAWRKRMTARQYHQSRRRSNAKVA